MAQKGVINMNKEIETKRGAVEIVPSVLSDAENILALIKSAPDALLDVSIKEIKGWIKSDQSMVAKSEGKIVGHQGMMHWEIPNIDAPLVELRSAFVDSNYRGIGINTKMKETMIQKAWKKYPEAVIVGFTEAASKSRGILEKLGFNEIPLNEAKEELFSICPEICFKKTGVDCGCKIYYLLPKILKYYNQR